MGGRKKAQTTGYHYSIGLHMVPCYGPVDSVNEIRIGERTVFGDASTEPKPQGYGIGELGINQPGLFGGEGREGGVVGTIGVLDGNSGQGVDSYLAANTGPTTPAYRGVLSVIWRRLRYAANNHYLKACAVRVTRIAQGWDNNAPWSVYPVTRYDSTLNRAVFVGANPAGIIVECLTNSVWGMGLPVQTGNFYQAANDLVNEAFGLNLLWTRQQRIEDFITLILDHIGGVLYVDPGSGRFALKLLRAPSQHELDGMFTMGPDQIVEMRRFERGQWGELPNQVTVVYTDWDTGKEATVTVENLASIQLQGGVINQRVDYPGVTDPPLAARLALRELRSRGTPLARLSFTLDPGGWKNGQNSQNQFPMPGEIIKLRWPRLNIDSMIVRVIGFNRGGQDGNQWEIDAVEDVFSFESAVLATSVPPPTPIATVPIAPSLVLAFEAPYWEVARNLSRGDLAFLEDTDCYAGALAADGGAGQINWGFQLGATASPLDDVSTEDYAPLLTLANALPATEADATALPLLAMSQPDRVTVGDYGYLVDAGGQWREIVQVLAFDSTLATVDIARGMLDSVPAAHAAGTRLVMAGDWLAVEQTARLPGEDVYIAAQPNTIDQAGPDAPAANGTPFTLGGRLARPYPPGRVRINTLTDPAAVPAGDVLIEWAHRDRIQQTAYLVRQDEGDIGPEPGVTYTVRILDRNGIAVRTASAVAGTSYTWLATDAATDTTVLDGSTFTVEIEAVRGGFVSLIPQRKTIDRPGYGLQYGNHYGGL